MQGASVSCCLGHRGGTLSVGMHSFLPSPARMDQRTAINISGAQHGSVPVADMPTARTLSAQPRHTLARQYTPTGTKHTCHHRGAADVVQGLLHRLGHRQQVPDVHRGDPHLLAGPGAHSRGAWGAGGLAGARAGSGPRQCASAPLPPASTAVRLWPARRGAGTTNCAIGATTHFNSRIIPLPLTTRPPTLGLHSTSPQSHHLHPNPPQPTPTCSPMIEAATDSSAPPTSSGRGERRSATSARTGAVLRKGTRGMG